MAKKATKATTNKETRIYTAIASLIIGGLLLISALKYGLFGIFIDKCVRYLFGDYHLVVFVLAILVCIIIIVKPSLLKQKKSVYLGILILFVTFSITSAIINNYDKTGIYALSHFIENSKAIFDYELSASGGFFGIIWYSLFTKFFDINGTYIFTGILFIIGFLLTFGVNMFKNIKMPEFKKREKKTKKEKTPKQVIDKTEPYAIGDLDVVETKKDDKGKGKSSIFISLDQEQNEAVASGKTQQLKLQIDDTPKEPYVIGGKNYKLPRLNLLDTAVSNRASSKNVDAAKTQGERLINVLNEFNIESELVDTHIGPSVTKFEIRPDTSVKVSRINSISDNIKMELAAKSIRIEAPIPGKNTVGIEVPNVENTPVKLYELLKDLPANEPPLLFALGKDLMGNVIFSDLAKMPHLLIAGATGAGKSVALNAIITTILLRTTPEEVRLLLIDPKKVEFNSFANAPHLMTDIINEPTQANTALMRIVEIMDDRYRDFAKINVKNIKAYNEYKQVNPDADLPNMELIVVIIDELADLMIVAGKEVEQSIQRITQLARAAGIHLIVATQRPSTDVITGIIKSNIPSRISFAVSSGIDSRTILDTVGAERLLGNGDMLYYPVGYSSPLRLQGVYISDDEVVKVANFAAKQPSPEHFEQFLFSEDDENNFPGYMNTEDALYEEVKEYVIAEQKASTSLIQRRFGIGYNRAARIIDALEAHAIIGPMNGSKPREVYLTEFSQETEAQDE